MSTALAHADDFPDRLPPMLIKELRQGMRAKTFVGIFLGLQAFLALLILVTGVATGSDRAGSAISGIIFFTFSIAVLIIQPLRGLSAVSSEVQGNTLDMMVLTRLSAWRIVLGKWSSIVIQSALLLVTIIPYLILRYFFGGMNLVGELMSIILIFVTSMGLTATTVGFSASSSKTLRVMLVIGGGMIVFGGFNFMLISLVGPGRFSFSLSRFDSETWIGIFCYLAYAAYFGGSMLSLGASLIAPAAENHATVRRLAALAALGIVWVVSFFFPMSTEGVAAMVAMVLTPALAIALSEHARLVPTVWKPFARRRAAGRVAGLLLCPGWASGFLFTVLATALGALVVASAESTTSFSTFSMEDYVPLLSLVGALLLAGLLTTFIRNPESERVAIFLLLMIALAVLAACIGGIAGSVRTGGVLYFFIWNPFIWSVMLESHAYDDDTALGIAMCGTLVLFGVFLARALAWLRNHREIFDEADRLVAQEKDPLAEEEAERQP